MIFIWSQSHARSQAVSREISALLAELRQAKPDEISTIRMMTQMLRAKEMDVELIYDEDGEVKIGAIH
jgi:hypothetical protein